ncbi:hypothetical protein V4F39_21750 [Aquincola sp. MAHUQ-54]|uniref:EF-hand domain-containing protein n=1 Tax=Aquincola agrisoli TaxID=3119538 RepID=A0AAW9QBC0_9BURK
MAHAWQFFRAGGVDQVVIASGADIAHLRELDQKLWVALACPTRGIDFDPRTLDLIDTDHDGRIRAPELIAACEWACARLKDPQSLVQGGARLALDALDDACPEGAALLEEARRTLQRHGDADATDIGLEQIGERQKHLAGERFNGDGVVTPATAGDDKALATLIERIVHVQGAVADAGGGQGTDRARATAFLDAAQALFDWHTRGEQDCGGLRAAAQAVDAVHDKVEDFFARCRLASYDARAAEALGAPPPEELRGYATQTLSLAADPLRQLPLAPVAPGRPLPLGEGANPAWQAALAALRTQAVAPLLGDDQAGLDEGRWQQLKARVAPCRAWLAQRPAGPVAALGVDAVRALVGADLGETRARLTSLIEQDLAAAPVHGHVNDLEKLVRLQRDLLPLLRNFVSFAAFYRREGAVFQAGRLFLDGRSCDLTVQVADAAKHAVVAGLAKAYLAYCECVRGKEKMTIAAAFTAGDVDFLFVGRNGLFYDREGRDWDARIIKVIENPISIGQAFLSPYKKFLRMIEEQVAKRAAASDATAQGKLGGWAGRIASADKSPPASAAAAPDAGAAAASRGRVDVGTVAALGVALGSISAVIVGVFAKFVDLGWWIPLAILGIVLSISGPSMLIAWLKLRQRSLGPILDAGGWAINGRMRLNVRLGASLSQTAHLPPGTYRRPDPFAERHGARWAVAAVVLAAAVAGGAWWAGWLDGALPLSLQRAPAVAVTG